MGSEAVEPKLPCVSFLLCSPRRLLSPLASHAHGRRTDSPVLSPLFTLFRRPHQSFYSCLPHSPRQSSPTPTHPDSTSRLSSRRTRSERRRTTILCRAGGGGKGSKRCGRQYRCKGWVSGFFFLFRCHRADRGCGEEGGGVSGAGVLFPTLLLLAFFSLPPTSSFHLSFSPYLPLFLSSPFP